ncbi:hypothetical protein DFQ02_1047 [Seonamhaeicola aphaedonensis]|uniref:Uncharacterized protein n=2 Tax=Seonamhaeicola aphaedonensis TaxID=1461338 RepID=A0A3D9HFB0_9FLAO|nr:hypothetical protein DFQ02_1047 [Seonamhaeicola aphaedonensis]
MVCLFMLSNCSLDNGSNSESGTITIVFWHLTNTSGGLAGVDDQFDLDKVIWSFNEVNSTLIIQNNNTDDTKQDGLPSGTYSFSVSLNSGSYFIYIDGAEFGSYSISDTELIIDQNITTSGTGADGFVYTFKKVTEEVDI